MWLQSDYSTEADGIFMGCLISLKPKCVMLKRTQKTASWYLIMEVIISHDECGPIPNTSKYRKRHWKFKACCRDPARVLGRVRKRGYTFMKRRKGETSPVYLNG